MQRWTAVVITEQTAYGPACGEAFSETGVFPVVVNSVDRAITLLREFRADVVVFQPAHGSEAEALYSTLADASPETPIVVYQELPAPMVLVAALKGVIARATGAAAEAGV